MGLSGMRDRVRMLGGETLIVPLPEGGLAVEARFGTPETAGDRGKLAGAPGGGAGNRPNACG